MRSAVDHAHAAYIGSVTNAARMEGWDARMAPGLLASVQGYNAQVSAVHRIPLPMEARNFTQRQLSQSIDEELSATEWESLSRDSRRRVTSQGGPGASSWLTVVPDNTLGFCFAPMEYITLLKWWLGEQVYGADFTCPSCGQLNDRLGYHAQVCKKGGDIVHRHHSMCNETSNFCRAAYLAPRREVSVEGHSRPADVWVPVWEAGKPLAMDFAVTHCLQQSYSTIADFAPAGSCAAAYARSHKHGSYAVCARQGVQFAPMVAEVYGAWDPAALPVLYRIASLYALHQGVSESQARKSLFQRLSVCLQRQNVRMVLARRDVAHAGEEEPLSQIAGGAAVDMGGDSDVDEDGDDADDVDVYVVHEVADDDDGADVDR